MFWLMQFSLALLAGMAAGVFVLVVAYHVMMRSDRKKIREEATPEYRDESTDIE